jgi:diguanylate cyclase (GGDEF)-like protein
MMQPNNRADGTAECHSPTTSAVEELGKALAALQASTSEMTKQKKQLEQLNGWFEVALNNMARGLSMFDRDQRLIVCNNIYREIYQLPEHLTQPGTPLADIIRCHFKHETGRETPRDLEDQRSWIESHVARLAKGKSFSHTQYLSGGRTILVTNQPLPDGGWVDLQEDITERRQSEKKIDWLARHDTLTEIPNRFHFQEQLEKALQCLAPGTGLAMHWIDLDRFKEVNDTLGHPVGDALLKNVGRRLQEVIRRPDFVGRLGGDEFAIVQTSVTGSKEAISFAERILCAIGETQTVLGHPIDVGASVGIALAPEHGRTADELLKKADLALYHVKSLGRGNYSLYQTEYGDKIEARHRLEADLKHALTRGQLELHYQPIVDVRTREVTAFEALMRWRHPQQGLIAPADFIPLAEETGLIVEFGAWALRQACADAATWPNDVRVSVNLSALQFDGSELDQVVVEALARAGLPAKRLELEITETVLLRDDTRTLLMLHKLRDLGVRISLDDFGTAFASLSYLRSFPFDKIKIDRSFVRELPQRGAGAAIIEAVAALARKLDISSLAEGIETLDHLNTVSDAGCDEVQGFYFSRPVPAAEITRVLSQCQPKLEEVA